MVFMIPTPPATAPPKNLDPLSVPSYLISTLAFLFFFFSWLPFTVAPHQYPSAARLFHSLLDIAFALFYSLYFFPLFPAVCCAHVCVSVCGYKNISFNFLFLLALAASLSLSLSSWSASRCPLYRTSAPASPSSGPSSISLALTRFRVQRFILPSQRTTRFLIFFRSACVCVAFPFVISLSFAQVGGVLYTWPPAETHPPFPNQPTSSAS